MKKAAILTLMSLIIVIPLLFVILSTDAAAYEKLYAYDKYIATLNNLSELPVEWRLARNGTNVIITDYITGTLSDAGGSIRFTQSGQYTLTAVITDAAGREFTATSDVTVYPVPNLSFDIVSIGYINIPVEVDANFTDVANQVLWSLTRNGEPAILSDYTTDSLTNNGGTITFTELGNYELTATITDATDRTFSEAKSIVIDNDLSCDFSIQSTNLHISKGITATMDSGTYTGSKNIEWTLTRSGSAASYTGSLDNTGGSINVSATGSYILKASITDSIGRVTTCSKSFSVFNNPPNTPVITRTPSDSVVNRLDPVRITAAATDSDGDTVTYVWENRSYESTTYVLGNHTARVKAVDQWGAESAWTSTSFTVAYLRNNYTLNTYAPFNAFTVSALGNDDVYYSSVSLSYDNFVTRPGYTYKMTISYYNSVTKQWELEKTHNIEQWSNVGRGFSTKEYTRMRIYYEINDPSVVFIPVDIKEVYYYP